MDASGLIGMAVSISVSDPWEFDDLHGDGPLVGKILQVGPDYWARLYSHGEKEALLLQLAKPLTFEGVVCEYFIASSRHETAHIGLLAGGDEVHCSLTRIPKEQATSLAPFDLHQWRGGIGLLALLKRVVGVLLL